MCGKGGAGVDGVVYEIGDVDVVFGKVGGIDVDVSDVEGVKAVGFEDGASVVGVSEDAAPEEAGSSEGASRVVERGQGRPAMEASRLFSMGVNMIIGIDMGKTNGCSDARKPVARHESKRSRRDGRQEMKSKRHRRVDERVLGYDQSSRVNYIEVNLGQFTSKTRSFCSLSVSGAQGRMTPWLTLWDCSRRMNGVAVPGTNVVE